MKHQKQSEAKQDRRTMNVCDAIDITPAEVAALQHCLCHQLKCGVGPLQAIETGLAYARAAVLARRGEPSNPPSKLDLAIDSLLGKLDRALAPAKRTTDPVGDKLTAIAKEHLGLETLECQNRDSLDFHEVYGPQVEKALRAAYELGRTTGQGR